MKKTPYPKIVTLGTTLKCNLSCIHCGTYPKRKGNLIDMPDEILNKCWGIIEHAECVNLDNEGEFLCNKDHLSIFRRARDMGKKTTITSNGMLVDDDVIENIIFDGLTYLNFSVDAVDPKTYVEFRKGGDYNKLINTIHKIFRLRAERNLKSPFIGLSFVLRRGNIEDVPAMVDLCHELGVDQMYIYHLTVLVDELRNECLFHHKELSDKYFKIAMEKNQGSTMFMRIPSLFEDEARASSDQDRFRECRNPWTDVYISANGDIMPCCDWRIIMGNLQEQTFDEIWNGERYRQLRDTVNVKGANPYCTNCVNPYLKNLTNPLGFFPFDRSV